jgi:hypothetical protein
MAAWEVAVCLALTAAGLAISWLAWRRSGPRRAVRVAAWSLLPLAVYLTGAVHLVGRMVSAIVSFAGSFVFSARSWAGVAVLGLAVLLFLFSGGLPQRSRRRRRAQAEASGTAAAGSGRAAGSPAVTGRSRPQPRPLGAAEPASRRGRKAAKGEPEDEDFAEVADILRRRGIS